MNLHRQYQPSGWPSHEDLSVGRIAQHLALLFHCDTLYRTKRLPESTGTDGLILTLTIRKSIALYITN